MDCIVLGVTKSQTRLSDFHFLSLSIMLSLKILSIVPYTVYGRTLLFIHYMLYGRTLGVYPLYPQPYMSAHPKLPIHPSPHLLPLGNPQNSSHFFS